MGHGTDPHILPHLDIYVWTPNWRPTSTMGKLVLLLFATDCLGKCVSFHSVLICTTQASYILTQTQGEVERFLIVCVGSGKLWLDVTRTHILCLRLMLTVSTFHEALFDQPAGSCVTQSHRYAWRANEWPVIQISELAFWASKLHHASKCCYFVVRCESSVSVIMFCCTLVKLWFSWDYCLWLMIVQAVSHTIHTPCICWREASLHNLQLCGTRIRYWLG